MAAPVRESWASTASAEGINFTVNVASGIVAGNFLLIIVSNDYAGVSPIMSLSGWTKIDEQGNSSSDCHIAAWWKEAAGGETDEVVSFSGFTLDAVGWYFRFSSVNMADPIYAQNGSQSSTSGNSFAMAALATIVDDYGVAATAWDGGDTLPLTMTADGWTELDEQGLDDSTKVGGNVGTNSAPGASGPSVTADASDGWAYIKIHIAPTLGPAIDNLSGVPGDTIVQISDVAVGTIDNMSGVPF
jgi:hypothetical protein